MCNFFANQAVTDYCGKEFAELAINLVNWKQKCFELFYSESFNHAQYVHSIFVPIPQYPWIQGISPLFSINLCLRKLNEGFLREELEKARKCSQIGRIGCPILLLDTATGDKHQ